MISEEYKKTIDINEPVYCSTDVYEKILQIATYESPEEGTERLQEGERIKTYEGINFRLSKHLPKNTIVGTKK